MSDTARSWWRLGSGLVAYGLLTSGDFSLVGLPLAALLVAGELSGPRDWALVVVAFALGIGGLLGTPEGRLDAVVATYEAIAVVVFIGIALLAPGSLLGMTLCAVATAMLGALALAWLQWGAAPFRPLHLEAMHETVSQLRQLTDRYPKQVSPELLARIVSTTIPATLALQTFAGFALAWQLHARLGRRPLGAALQPFREFRFGDGWIWGVVAALTIWLVPALAAFKGAALNLSVVLGALYLLRGAAIVVAFASATGISTTVLTLIGVAAAIFAIPLLLILPGLWTLGLFDTWMEFRRRLASRPTHT